MSSKLTLRINSLLIEKAKGYAKQHGKSVSQIVGDYFSLLGKSAKSKGPSLPLTQSLRGVLKKSAISENDYKKYIEKKYL